MNVVYRLYCKDPEATEFYIGSAGCLYSRLAVHKTLSKMHVLKLYNYMRAHGGYKNWDVEILDVLDDNVTRQDMIKREKEWIEKLKPTLNINSVKSNLP